MDVQAIRTVRDAGDRTAEDLRRALDRAGFTATVTASAIVRGRTFVSVEAIPLDDAQRLTARLLQLAEIPRVDESISNDEPGGTPEVDRVARDCHLQRLGLVLEIDVEGDRVRLRDLSSGLPWWAARADVRAVSSREELSLRMAAAQARDPNRRIEAVEARGLQ